MTQVVAFTCQQCGVDFPAMGGGVCGSCKRTLCASHYGRPTSDEEAAADTGTLICDECRASGARGGRSAGSRT